MNHQYCKERARKALKESDRKVRKPKGGQKLWTHLVKKDLEELNIVENQDGEMAQKRNALQINQINQSINQRIDQPINQSINQ